MSYSMQNSGESLSQPLYGANPVQAITRFFKKYARFSGYASRSEYWWAVGMISVITFVLMIPVGVASVQAEITGETSAVAGLLSMVIFVWYLAIFVPSLSIAWRRLHDAGFSGAFFFLSFIPFIGGIILMVLTIIPTQPSKHMTVWNDTRGD